MSLNYHYYYCRVLVKDCFTLREAIFGASSSGVLYTDNLFSQLYSVQYSMVCVLYNAYVVASVFMLRLPPVLCDVG